MYDSIWRSPLCDKMKLSSGSQLKMPIDTSLYVRFVSVTKPNG